MLAAGVLVDTALIGAAEARRRVLSLHEQCLDVFEIGKFLVVRFRAATRVDCGESIGTPLVHYDALYSTAPLDVDEVRLLSGGSEAVVIVQGGVASTFPLAASDRRDVSLWFDVSDFEVERAAVSLGEIASTAVAQFEEHPADIRAPLNVAPFSAEGAALVASLAKGELVSSSSPSRGLRAFTSALAVILRAFGSLISAFVKHVDKIEGVDTRSLPPAEPPWFQKARARLQFAAARLLAWTRLDALIGRQYARHLTQLVAMLDAHDFDAALRHAIPLNAELENALKPPALSAPSPRASLAIAPHRTAASSTIGLGDSIFDLLKKKYRRAFERLVEQGDIDKAAFVLAELLNASEEAVSFLERHGRYRLAAEIAEARKLPAGIIIRQWFLAGDKARAVQVARRTGAFADAVTRLERTHKDEGRSLRLLWADMLATAGAYAAAVDAVWPIEAARPLAKAWIDRAIAVGGVTGARMLVRKVRAFPDTFTDVRDRVLALLAAEDTTFADAIGREVLAASIDASTRVIAKIVARAVIGKRIDHASEHLVRHLLEASCDAAFRADVAACNEVDAKSSSREVDVCAFGVTHIGKKRRENEDGCVATLLRGEPSAHDATAFVGFDRSNGVLLGAFDASGGSAVGDSCAKLAANTIFTSLKDTFNSASWDVDRCGRGLVDAVVRANQAIALGASENESLCGMACEATVASIAGDTLVVAQVGTTRGYLLRDRRLVQLTRDHSLLNDWIDAGHAQTPEEIEAFPHKHVVMRALGVKREVSVDLLRVPLNKEDVILLCSDGLSSVIDDARIRDVLGIHTSPRPACEALLSMALDAGAPDNIAIVVAYVGNGLPSGAPVRVTKVDGQMSSSDPIRVTREVADAGAIPVFEAAELPDGRMLVALGEIGAWVLSRDGKVQVRFIEPASQIVMSDHGDRAIVSAARGTAHRLAKIDLRTNRVEPWCDALIGTFAHTFDGSTWLVASDNEVFAIDATSTGWEHIWNVQHDDGGTVSNIERDAHRFCVSFVPPPTAASRASQLSIFEHSFALRRRIDVETAWMRVQHYGLSPAGVIASSYRDENGVNVPCVFVDGNWKNLPLTSSQNSRGAIVTDAWLAYPFVTSTGMAVHLYDVKTLSERLILRLEGSEDAYVRIDGDRLVVADTCGRVLVIALDTGAVLREFRVS